MTDKDKEHDVEALETQLNDLENECSHLIALLRDRHVGLVSWRYLTGDRMKKVKQIIEELGVV
jgi:hypothetical protein